MRSMTGYGSGSASFPGGRVTVELRTVNHRFLEIKMPLARDLLAYESEFRALIEARLKRGKLDMFMNYTGKPTKAYEIEVDLELAKGYRRAISRLQQALGLTSEIDLSFLSAHPGLFQIREKPQAMQAQVTAVKKALTTALRALETQRAREGAFLQRELRARVQILEKIRRQVYARSGIVIQNAKERFKERIAALLQGVLPGGEIDQGRLLQEAATAAQRGDITEELVRFAGHLTALNALLRTVDPVGKRIDFLLQEIQREINTIGSKADDVEIRHLVVAGKEEVEKLREQVQNIE